MSQTTPIIILHHPQLGENIGSAARVMLNFGLTDLHLVAPRDGWPNSAADPLSAGAFEAGISVTVFETVEAAIADLGLLLATTARPRGMEKAVVDAAGGADMIRTRGLKTGILFGAENHGLPSDVVGLADAILTYPVNPAFASLNLAQAVGVFCASWGAVAGAAHKHPCTEIHAADLYNGTLRYMRENYVLPLRSHPEEKIYVAGRELSEIDTAFKEGNVHGLQTVPAFKEVDEPTDYIDFLAKSGLVRLNDSHELDVNLPAGTDYV